MAEAWKTKRLVRELEAAKGNGTSMISIMVPAGGQVARVQRMLCEEFGTATNIKSRVNRQSVLSAITSAQERLKLLNNKIPPNGLALFCGLVTNEDGKERKLTMALEPFKPMSASLYLCDNRFHVKALKDMLEVGEQKYGFIVMDGNGALYGSLCGNHKDILHKFNVDLPKKHGRGGQSALRFARIRMETRHNYVRKVAEFAVNCFIDQSSNQANVVGIIVAGSAELKNELVQSPLFDPRLKEKVINVVDVCYGGENGFNQAIEQSADILANVKYIHEKRLIAKFFEEISLGQDKYVFGVDDTLKALHMGAVETLILWEELAMTRLVVRNVVTGELVVKHVAEDEEFSDPEFEVKQDETGPLIDWLVEEYAKFGCSLELVTNKSELGSQFCKGFGGIGGILRYQLDMRSFDEPDEEEGSNSDEDNSDDDKDIF